MGQVGRRPVGSSGQPSQDRSLFNHRSLLAGACLQQLFHPCWVKGSRPWSSSFPAGTLHSVSFSHPVVALLEQQHWRWLQMQHQVLFGLVPAAVPEVWTVCTLLGESHQCRLAVAVYPLLTAAFNQLTPLRQFPQHTSWVDGWQLQLFLLFLYPPGQPRSKPYHYKWEASASSAGISRVTPSDEQVYGKENYDYAFSHHWLPEYWINNLEWISAV